MADNEGAPPKGRRPGAAAETGAAREEEDVIDDLIRDINLAVEEESASLDDVLSERDQILDDALLSGPLQETEEEIGSRDPFAADYLEFLRGKAVRQRKDPRRVDAELRANLLEKPYLTERPEEAGLRGAAAVWRSLRDQIREESLNMLDTSKRDELLMLQRELKARKSIVESVDHGLGLLLQRLKQRLDTLPPEDDLRVAGEEAD